MIWPSNRPFKAIPGGASPPHAPSGERVTDWPVHMQQAKEQKTGCRKTCGTSGDEP